MQNGSSLTEGLRRRAIAKKEENEKISKCFFDNFLTFDDRNQENVKEQRSEEIYLHFVQVFVVKHVSES